MTYCVRYGHYSQSTADFETWSEALSFAKKQKPWCPGVDIIKLGECDDADDASARGQAGLSREEWRELEELGWV